MESDKYIQERLDGQQKWYSKKSAVNKNYYQRLNITTIVLAVLIPLVSGIESLGYLGVSVGLITGALGALVAILTAVSGFLKFKEKYLNYRMSSERLKSERYLWATKTFPYHKADAFHILVQRVEAIIKSENGDWGTYIVEENEIKKVEMNAN